MISKLLTIPSTSGRSQRLKSRKLITRLFSEGSAVSAFPLRAIYMVEKAQVPLQTGFTVSSRNFGKAVQRNRLKRLMREAFRLQKKQLQELLETSETALQVFFIYTGKNVDDSALIESKMRVLLKKLEDLSQNNIVHSGK